MNKKVLSVLMILVVCTFIGCGKKPEKQTSVNASTPEAEVTTQAATPEITATPEVVTPEVTVNPEATTPEAAESTDTADLYTDLSTLPEPLQDVIYQEASFIDAAENSTYTLSTYTILSGDDEKVPVIWKDYIVMDIDVDGKNELIVHVNDANNPDSCIESVYIFDSQKDGVYGYSYPYRGVLRVYEDGVMSGSSGAADNRFYTAKFNGLNQEDVVVAESVSTFENDTPGVVYTIGKEKVSKDEFYEYIKKYSVDFSISWSEENLIK